VVDVLGQRLARRPNRECKRADQRKGRVAVPGDVGIAHDVVQIPIQRVPDDTGK